MSNEDVAKKLAKLRLELTRALGLHEWRAGKPPPACAADDELIIAAYNTRRQALIVDHAQWKLGIVQEQAEAVGKDLTKAEARIAELEAELKRRDEQLTGTSDALVRAQVKEVRTSKAQNSLIAFRNAVCDSTGCSALSTDSDVLRELKRQREVAEAWRLRIAELDAELDKQYELRSDDRRALGGVATALGLMDSSADEVLRAVIAQGDRMRKLEKETADRQADVAELLQFHEDVRLALGAELVATDDTMVKRIKRNRHESFALAAEEANAKLAAILAAVEAAK